MSLRLPGIGAYRSAGQRPSQPTWAWAAEAIPRQARCPLSSYLTYDWLEAEFVSALIDVGKRGHTFIAVDVRSGPSRCLRAV